MSIAVLPGRSIGDNSTLDIVKQNPGVSKYSQFSGNESNDCPIENLNNLINVSDRGWAVSRLLTESVCKRLA